MHVTSISHHVPNRVSTHSSKNISHDNEPGIATTETLSVVISSSFSYSEAFSSFRYNLATLKKPKISDLNLPSLSCFGDCMSGNDDVLAVDDTDTRSPVRWTKKQFFNGTQNSRN